MFEDSLVESAGKIKTKKGSTVIISAIVHIVLVLVLIIVPLIFTEQIEGAKLTSFLVAPPPPPPARYWTEDQVVRFHDRDYRIVARLDAFAAKAAELARNGAITQAAHDTG